MKNLRYRVRIDVVPGLVKRARYGKVWLAFESPCLGMTTAVMTRAKAERLYARLLDLAAQNKPNAPPVVSARN